MIALKSRTDIINWLIEAKGYRSYLEIGVGEGENFRAIVCEEKECVDPSLPGDLDFPVTHPRTSDAFFSRNTRRYDLIFVDGLHHAEVVYRDIVNSLAALNPGGAVICHDINPHSEAMQRVPRREDEWTGDCWRAWLRIRSERDDLAVAVADVDCGVGVILPDGSPKAARLTPCDTAD